MSYKSFLNVIKGWLFLVTVIQVCSCNPSSKAPLIVPPAPADPIALPTFTITKDELMTQYNEKWPQRLLIKVSFGDVTDYKSMKLQVYVAKTHYNYARNSVPLVVNQAAMTAARYSKSFTIGNTELELKSLLFNRNGRERNYTSLVFTPKLITYGDDPNYHLVFSISASGESAHALADDPFNDAKPSPPAPPGGDY